MDSHPCPHSPPSKNKQPQSTLFPQKHSQLLTTSSPSSLLTLNPYQLDDQYIQNNFKPSNKYKFDRVNMLRFAKGRIYNILEKDLPPKAISCNCLKSNCSVNYCQCYRSGQVCSSECRCRDCKNKTKRQKYAKMAPEPRCNCAKTQCLKKYCECLQKGLKCNSKCRCIDCKNTPASFP